MHFEGESGEMGVGAETARRRKWRAVDELGNWAHVAIYFPGDAPIRVLLPACCTANPRVDSACSTSVSYATNAAAFSEPLRFVKRSPACLETQDSSSKTQLKGPIT